MKKQIILALILTIALLQAKDPAQYNHREKLVASLINKMPQESGEENDSIRRKLASDIITFKHEALPVVIDSWSSSFSEPKQQAMFDIISDKDVTDTNIYSLILNKFKTSKDPNKAYLAAFLQERLVGYLVSSNMNYIRQNKGYLPLELLDSIMANTANEYQQFNIRFDEMETISIVSALTFRTVRLVEDNMEQIYPEGKFYLTTGDYAKFISRLSIGYAIEYTPENQMYSDENAKKHIPGFTSAQLIGWYKKYRNKLIWVGDEGKFLIDEQYKKILDERNVINDN